MPNLVSNNMVFQTIQCTFQLFLSWYRMYDRNSEFAVLNQWTEFMSEEFAVLSPWLMRMDIKLESH